MNILVTPEDIIRRCLFSSYKKFILKDKTKAETIKIIEDNEIHSLSENDAYVIGLLKVVETDNLVHRFRLEIEEFIKIKTTVNNERVIINKTAIVNEISNFKNRFPEYYVTDKYYQEKIDELKVFIDEVYEKVIALESIEILFKDKKFMYVFSKEVNKIFKF